MLMSTQGYRFARLLWLYGEIVTKGPITYRQIADNWQRSALNYEGDEFKLKTFENHRRDVEDMFGIIIDCDRSNNTYYISGQLDFSKATMDMLNGALLFNKVQSNPQMSRYIRPEQSGEDSSMLFTVTDAIAEGRELKLRYRHNYDPKRETAYRVKPIAVKQFRNRWYIIAELEDGTTYSFPLDRILLLSKGEKKSPSKLDVDELFADAFGIIREAAIPVEKIILKVEREQANYFISRPLHSSQTIVERTDEFVTFSLRVCPTYDFIMEILSHGPKVEVLAPQSLRNVIFDKVKELYNMYSK